MRQRIMQLMWPNMAPSGPIQFVGKAQHKGSTSRIFRIGDTKFHVPEDEPLQDTLNRFYHLGKELAG
jgi:hypothetical protein